MFFSNVTIIFNKYLLDTAGFRESRHVHVTSDCPTSSPRRLATQIWKTDKLSWQIIASFTERHRIDILLLIRCE